jgi:hypothetical protein
MSSKINFSGFLQQTVLLSLDDLKKLFESISPFEFFNVSSVQTQGSKAIGLSDFLDVYEQFLKDLFEEERIDVKKYGPIFSLAIASSQSCFFKQEFSEGRFLLKPKRSVIQLQPLGLFVSSLDREIHIKSFAQDAESFGLKLSFPTIYEDVGSHQIHELKPDDSEYTKFNLIRQFVRHHTKPLIIVRDQEKKVYSVRYSEDLKSQVSKMSFFERHGLKVII